MSDYSGETVDLEVARYGLRTFRPTLISQLSMSSDELWMQSWRRLTLMWGGDLFDDVFNSESPKELCSTAMQGSHWKGGVCEATCQKEQNSHEQLLIQLAALTEGIDPVFSHAAPQEDCHCGIYAAHTLRVLQDQFTIYVKDIVAVIAAEGQTIIGDKGFRTERARVVAYWCSDRIASTAESQFSEAQRFSELASMLAEYGLEEGTSATSEKHAWPQLTYTPSTGYTYSFPGGFTLAPSSGVLSVPALTGPSAPADEIRPHNVGYRKYLSAAVNFAASAVNLGIFAVWHSLVSLSFAVVSLAIGVFFLMMTAADE